MLHEETIRQGAQALLQHTLACSVTRAATWAACIRDSGRVPDRQHYPCNMGHRQAEEQHSWILPELAGVYL